MGTGHTGPHIYPSMITRCCTFQVAIVQWINDIRRIRMARAFWSVYDNSTFALKCSKAALKIALYRNISWSLGRINSCNELSLSG